MLQWLWNKENFLTDSEFEKKKCTPSNATVQEIVEKPQMYLLAKSTSSDEDQLKFADTRLQDLVQSIEPVVCDNIEYHDVNRFFVGDTPARQIESGQQRGGNKPCPCGASSAQFADLIYCLRRQVPTLKERIEQLHEYNPIILNKIEKGKLLTTAEM